MTGIYIEILESEVDDLLEILCAVDTPLISPATPPLAERIADRIIQSAVTKVDHEQTDDPEKEVHTFEQEVECRLANLEDVLLSEYAAGQKSGLEYGLAIYQECQEDDSQLLRFVETNPGCTIQHIDEFAPLRLTGVKELLYSDEIVCKRVNGTPCYFIPSHVEQSSVKQLEKLADITRKTCELKMKEQSVDRKFFTLETAYQLGTMAIQFGLGLLCGYIVGCSA